ncbi:hypothetical protein CK203_064840 [Vitis vinifera]|uniref:Uncharacterized protein n=1 Tax=Vitis vinifera TaxID=29760 RepID=A0A438G3L4_VITVI|nr:hypothetical protein CK203_064840 [Vitis vinifera]
MQGHDTERCLTLHHAIQDLIDSGVVDLVRPSTNGIWCFGTFQDEDLGQSAWVHRLVVVQLRALFILIMVIIRVIFHFVEVVSRWFDPRRALHDDRWIVMREWLDCLMMLLRQMDRHGASRFEPLHMTSESRDDQRWELSHDFRGVAMTMLDGCQS